MLTAAWRSETEPAVVPDPPPLSAAGRKHESGALNTHELVELPAGWKAWPIESVTETVVDYRGRTPPTTDAGIPHLRTTNIAGGRIDWQTDRFVTDETYERYMTGESRVVATSCSRWRRQWGTLA